MTVIDFKTKQAIPAYLNTPAKYSEKDTPPRMKFIDACQSIERLHLQLLQDMGKIKDVPPHMKMKLAGECADTIEILSIQLAQVSEFLSIAANEGVKRGGDPAPGRLPAAAAFEC